MKAEPNETMDNRLRPPRSAGFAMARKKDAKPVPATTAAVVAAANEYDLLKESDTFEAALWEAFFASSFPYK
ncbi:hypothetical protein V3851_11575 [Paenibacillus sp. M1]|uniref:Uncharacterized protein n=1 Tax=Paenibacillus haidiansis TaxID=1574488 RepID=A0ABU7VRR8_9BACL